MKNCISVLYLTGFALVFAIAATAADDPTLTFKFKDPINIPKAYQTEPGVLTTQGFWSERTGTTAASPTVLFSLARS